MASGSDLTQDIGLEKNQCDEAVPTLSYKLVVFGDTHQNCVTQAPHQVDSILEDPFEQHQTQNFEQPIEQHQTQDVEQLVEQQPEGVDVTLRRLTRIKKHALPSDYQVHLQESQYDFGVENDPKSFLQAINSCNSKLWYDAMKDELESMKNNKV